MLNIKETAVQILGYVLMVFFFNFFISDLKFLYTVCTS